MNLSWSPHIVLHHTRPGLAYAEFAALVYVAFGAVVAQNHGVNAEERPACAARLYRMRTRQGGYQYPARLRLPPGIDNGTFAVADFFIIPNPRLGIYRLADGAEDSEGVRACILRAIHRPAASTPEWP